MYYRCIFCSIHIKIEEKVMLTAGRHGGLQNMEVRGIVMLRITDPNLSKICIAYENRDSKGFQMQVKPLFAYVLCILV